jgi:hypothetical protein
VAAIKINKKIQTFRVKRDTPLASNKLVRHWLIPAIIGAYFAIMLFIIGAGIGLAATLVAKGALLALSFF